MKREKIQLILGDCLEKMKDISDNSVDAVVADPPYGLGFMGKKWDALPPGKEVFEQCLRVLKPGGHLLSFGGTRTYHRMAVAIEDAGFEVRDMIEWVYGSGFPKSLNIGKAVDKLWGNERKEFKRTDGAGNKQDYLASDRTKSEAGVFGGDKKVFKDSKGTSEWEGWGTALKPAHEPICMARKPLNEKSVAENCLKWGTGGINIDECRVEYKNEKDKKEGQSARPSKTKDTMFPIGGFDRSQRDDIQGRFPVNLIHDNSLEVREYFPDSGKQGKRYNYTNQKEYKVNGFVPNNKPNSPSNWGDSGNASRFFKSIIYTPKASKAERNRGCEGLEEKPSTKNFMIGCEDKGNNVDSSIRKYETPTNQNNHPTVKPIALMEYLIKMITPKDGTVLDPFMGSGTTGVACINLNRNFIGIELDENYFNIAKERIKNAQAQTKLL